MANNGAAHPNKIDLITGRDSYINLVVVQTETLTDELLLGLQDKLNNYVSFALDGQLVENYPEAKGKDVTISIDLYQNGNPSTFPFLEKAKDIFAQNGVILSWTEKADIT